VTVAIASTVRMGLFARLRKASLNVDISR